MTYYRVLLLFRFFSTEITMKDTVLSKCSVGQTAPMAQSRCLSPALPAKEGSVLKLNSQNTAPIFRLER